MNFKITIFIVTIFSFAVCPAMELRKRKVLSKQEIATLIKQNEEKKIEEKRTDYESNVSYAVECCLFKTVISGSAVVALHEFYKSL